MLTNFKNDTNLFRNNRFSCEYISASSFADLFLPKQKATKKYYIIALTVTDKKRELI